MGTRAVFTSEGDGPIIASDGDVNLLCGACGFAICENLLNAAQVTNLVLVCPGCKQANETRL